MSDLDTLRQQAADAISAYVEACILEDLNPRLAIMSLIADVAAKAAA